MPHQNIVFHDLLKHVPWAVFDRLVDEHHADWDERMVKSKAHLIAMLYAPFFFAERGACARSKLV